MDRTIIVRLFLALIFSGLIGYEREVSESNAGIKTHILVGVGAAIIALIQVEIVDLSIKMINENPINESIIKVDMTRLIAQVVSGIGFLGAGTIIVTKRNITGLTTAASIWTVANIGIALGLGLYQIAVLGFIFVISTLFIFKRVIQVQDYIRISIRYLKDSDNTLDIIEDKLRELGYSLEVLSHNSDFYGEQIVYQNIIKINHAKDVNYLDIVNLLASIPNIISIEKTNIE